LNKQKRVGIIETMQLMYDDYAHRCQLFKTKQSVSTFLNYLLLPGTIAVIIHRITHYLYTKNFIFRIISRFIYLFNIFLTGADISPSTQIGKGFMLFHTVATTISGKLGDNVIISAKPTIGGGGDSKDVGAGGGLPVIGDNIKIGANITIIGGIVISDGVNIAAGTIVSTDIEQPYVLVAGSPGKVIKKVSRKYSIFGQQDK